MSTLTSDDKGFLNPSLSNSKIDEKEERWCSSFFVGLYLFILSRKLGHIKDGNVRKNKFVRWERLQESTNSHNYTKAGSARMSRSKVCSILYQSRHVFSYHTHTLHLQGWPLELRDSSLDLKYHFTRHVHVFYVYFYVISSATRILRWEAIIAAGAQALSWTNSLI